VSSTTVESLETAARLLQYALDNTTDVASAFSRANAAADLEQRRDLSLLEEMISPKQPSADTAANTNLSSNGALKWLIGQLAGSQPNLRSLLQQYQQCHSLSASAALIVTQEFSGFLSYLMAVLTVLIVVSLLYGALVLPQFSSLYQGFGRELPALTALVFGPWGLILVATVLALLVVAFAMSWCIFRLRNRCRHLEPLPEIYERVPIFGAVAAAFNRWLWVAYGSILQAGGVDPSLAVQAATARIPRSKSLPQTRLLAELGSAERLGRLSDEIQHQRLATMDTFSSELYRTKRKTRIALTVFVYSLVAILVSAMYLPIFSLGSAI
jgi:type II secretory pathway component PulF